MWKSQTIQYLHQDPAEQNTAESYFTPHLVCLPLTSLAKVGGGGGLRKLTETPNSLFVHYKFTDLIISPHIISVHETIIWPSQICHKSINTLEKCLQQRIEHNSGFKFLSLTILTKVRREEELRYKMSEFWTQISGF